MGEKVTRAEFARRTGVDRASITYAVKSRKIPSDDDGRIDLDDPAVKFYIARKGAQSKASGANGRGRPMDGARPLVPPTQVETEPPPTTTAVRPTLPDLDLDNVQLDLVHETRKEQIRLTRAKTQKQLLEIGERTGDLIRRDVVARGMSLLDTSIEESFRQFGMTIADDVLLAAGQGKTAPEIAALIQRSVDAGLRSFREASQRGMREMARAAAATTRRDVEEPEPCAN